MLLIIRRRRGKHTENGPIDNKNKLEIVEGQDLNSLGNISIKDLKAAMEMFSFYQKPAKTPEEALHKTYQFWNTQPVPKMGNLTNIRCSSKLKVD